jgi:hypothetical protein
MSAHTPGPWKIWRHAISHGVTYTVHSRTEVAILIGSTNGLLGSDYPSDEEAEANAKLIAIAPELLRRLCDLVEGLEDIEKLPGAMPSRIKKARTAIAQATGDPS